jgi:hypothetical protein|nr:MAG TPA: Spherulation-specific family 4 [Caudoviricetes sp.]
MVLADLTWYSKTRADQVFATKDEVTQVRQDTEKRLPDTSVLAKKSEMAEADLALGGRIDAVKATAEAAVPRTEAASTYTTKEEAQAESARLTRSIDSVRSTAEAAATKTELTEYATTSSVASTYATKESLSGYLKTDTAAERYATKEALAQAQLGGGGQAPDLSGFATKADVRQADDALGSRIDGVKATADAALPKDSAAATYATKSDLSPYLRSADAASTYAPKASLADYVTRSDADQLYASNDNLQRELGQKAGLADLNDVTRRVDSLGAALSPFKPGERYYSPVTYFWPDYYDDGKPGKTSKWAQILKFAGSLGIVILNRHSGDWDTYEADFKKQAELALAAGAKRAVFYMKTQYLAATLPAGDPGRNNIPNVDKYTPDQILGQIEKAKTQYGGVCQGVFLDEVITGWGAQAGRVAAYKSLIDTIRAKYGKDFLIVVNTGANISQDMCKLDFDVCMMFEKDATAFLNEDPGTPILPDHMKAYPSTRWWAVVHGVTSENYRKVFDKADSLGIAHLYITDGQLREDPQQGGQWEPVGNPYANPPSSHILELVVPWLKGYLPLKLEVDDLRSHPKVISLGKHEAVPAGTPAGTIIVRKEA